MRSPPQRIADINVSPISVSSDERKLSFAYFRVEGPHGRALRKVALRKAAPWKVALGQSGTKGILVMLNETRLTDLLAKFSTLRFAVIGDFFLDKYYDVDRSLEERSIETGLPAHQVTGIRVSPGAAGTVVQNLVALGAQHVRTIGFTGDDGEGYALRRELTKLGCETQFLVTAPDRYTPTYLKPRDRDDSSLQGEHSRYDTKNRTPTPTAIQEQIIAALTQTVSQVDAILVMDQVEEPDCGVLTTRLIETINHLAAIHPQPLWWADSRRRIHDYRHLIIKPNLFEATGNAEPLPPSGAIPPPLTARIRELVERNARPVIVTLGHRGVLVAASADSEPVHVPAIPVPEPTDPTGAGDSFSAGMTLALAAGATLTEAAMVGNLVASITVRQLATTGTATPEQLQKLVATLAPTITP